MRTNTAPVPMPDDMTRAELHKKEIVIASGRKAFIEVGTALADIRDRRGYRFEYKTFEEYCKTRWGWSQQSAHYYIDAAAVVKHLPETSTQVEVSHARELSRLVKPSEKGNGARKEIDHDAVREVAGEIDFTTATVKQVAEKVDAKLKARRTAKKQNELAALAETFTLQAESAPAPDALVRIYNRDARELSQFVTPDVDLVFTSPPYNVGMNYRTHNDHMSPMDYRDLLSNVFYQCWLVMNRGARIGVNVPFGMDRDPYRPFVPLIFEILQACGFTLIGQTIWDKGQQAVAGSTAWGSYASPSAPRFRDRCEAIVWAYKESPTLEIPKDANLLIDGDTFRTLAQDYWHVPPASNPNHPAVFPPALAENALRFFGYEGCHLLDPFAGIGNGGIAARTLKCRASLVEIDAAYCALAQASLETE